MDRQTTVSRPASCSGVGLHSGEVATLTLRPAAAGSGVRFIRKDISGRDNTIRALALNVSTTQLGTNITNADGVSVATVEHFLAACAGLGLDNAIAELDGPELPILDGSSAPFIDLIQDAGIEQLAEPRLRLRVLRPVEIRDGVKFARLSPGDGFTITAAIDFPSRAIGRQTMTLAMKPGEFGREIAWARTFGFAHEIEKLRSMGLARGGSLQNAIVVDGDTVLNSDGPVTPDEFVRHKVLDIVGDLFLAGAPIEGAYEGEQPGHALNNRLLRALFADPDAFRLEAVGGDPVGAA